jgi:tetratricopeptide (TPR) repeat protein
MASHERVEYMRGVKLALRGDLDGAISSFETCLRLDPDALDPALNLLEAYQDAGRWADAESLADQLIRRWSDREPALVAVARLRQRQGRPEEGLALLRHPKVRITTESFAYPVYLRLLLGAGRFDEALREAERGLSSTVFSAHARLARGEALSHIGRHEEALRMLQELDAQEFGLGDPLRSGLLPIRAAAMVRAGESESARQLLLQALERTHDSAVVNLYRELFDESPPA